MERRRTEENNFRVRPGQLLRLVRSLRTTRGNGHTRHFGSSLHTITNGMVRRFYRANGAVIRGGGGLPWNYTPSALILVRQSFIWSGLTCVGRSWCARSSRAHSCCASLPTYTSG